MSLLRRSLLLLLLVAGAFAAYAWWHGWRPGQEAAPGAAGEKFTVLDVSERSLDGKPALAVLFSNELNPHKDYDRYLTVLVAKDKASTEVSGGWVMSDDHHVLYFADIEPETSYEIRIAGSLPDTGGQTLGDEQSHKVATRKIAPAYGFASKGSVLPARISEGLPIVTVNVPEVAIEFLRVKDDSLGQFFNNYYWQSGQSRTSASTLEEISKYTDSVYYGRFTVRAEPNARTLSNIAVEKIDVLRKPGLYMAVMTRPGHYDWELQTSYFFVTDIGLQARRYEKRIEIYASSLAGGDAMNDVELEILDSKGHSIAKGETDRHGHATLDLALKPEFVLTARHGKDLSLLAFNQPALDLSAFSAAGPSQHPLEVFVYSPRDLYRPGETVDLSMLLRDFDGRAVNSQPLTAKLQRPDGKQVRQFTLSPEALGYYHTAVEIPDDAPTGQWSLLVYTDPASKQPVREYPFKVEDFMPERMKLALDSQQAWLKPGEPFEVSIQGDYLYGAPAGGNRVTSVLNVRPEPHPLPELKEFNFGDVNESNEKRREELPDLTLDEQGHADLKVMAAEQAINSPLAARLSVNLFESGGRPVARTFVRTVWPANELVGIRPLFQDDTAAGEDNAEFEVTRVHPDGKPAPGNGLLVKLIKEDRDYYWSYDENNGWREQFNEKQFAAHTDTVNVAGDKPAKLSVPVEYGRYRLDVFDPQTKLTARYRFYAGWGEREDQTGPDRVMLKLDKPSYKAGDKVKLQVLPPHAGSALIMVEGDQTLWSDRVDVPADGKTVSFHIDKDWNRHDLYVNVIVLRPGDSEEHITPTRAVGLIHLPLDRSERQLKPVITAATKMRPLKPLDVAVQLDGLAGQPAFVTIAAVDVGVLNITRFETPDPFKYFFQQHRFGPDLYDLYGRIIENLQGAKAQLRFGGDEDVSADRSKLGRTDVKIASLFSGPVEVGVDGKAHVKLDLPDFNGTLRLMTVAYSADHFGSSESEVVVAAPVVAEAATPRFLAPGDETHVTLDLHNMSGAPQSLSVKLSADGPLKLKSSETVQLATGKRQTLRIPLTADEAYGIGNIRLEVTGKSGPEPVKIDRQWQLSVRPAYPGDRRVQLKILKPGESLVLDPMLAHGLMPLTVEGTLALSSQAPLNLRDAVQGLLGYPYGCAEQTTSTAFPLIYIDEARAKEFDIKNPLALAERSKRVDAAFARLAGLQTSSGGFALWPNDQEDPWITPYVTDFLLQARDQGFAVPEGMLKKALDRLLEQLQSGSDLAEGHWTQSPAHLGLSSKAYSAYVLARVQRAPLGTLRTLYDNHAKFAETGLPLVQLGLAFVLQGEKQKGLEAIKAGIAKATPEDRYLGDYGSPVRDDALMLALLLRHHDAIGDVPGINTLVLRLSNDLRGRQYYSTQERFALLLAGIGLEMEKPKPWSAEIASSHGVRKVDVARRLLQGFDFADLRSGLKVKPAADVPLYAITDLAGYPSQAPKPRTDLIDITRGYYDMNGKAIGKRPLKTGEMILVYLQIDASDRVEETLVTDLVPAGLEVENLNLAQGETLKDVMVEGINPTQSMSDNAPRYQEFRDDRYVAAVSLYGGEGNTRYLFYLARVVSPGKFHVPPPFAEDMYRPEIFGIGETPPMLEVKE